MTAPTVSETLVRVNYSETDQMGVAYHARYLVWLDVARTEHLRRCGASYRDLEAAGLRLAVSELAIRYRQPARFDDLVRSAAGSATSRRGGSTFGYAVEHADDGRLLATATRGAARARRLDGARPACPATSDAVLHVVPDPVKLGLTPAPQEDAECIDADRVPRVRGSACPGVVRSGSALSIARPLAAQEQSRRRAARARAGGRGRARLPARPVPAGAGGPRLARAADGRAGRRPDRRPPGHAARRAAPRRSRHHGPGRGRVRPRASSATPPPSQPLIDRLTGLAGARRDHRGRGHHRAGQDRRSAERRVLRRRARRQGDAHAGRPERRVPRRSSASRGGWAPDAPVTGLLPFMDDTMAVRGSRAVVLRSAASGRRERAIACCSSCATRRPTSGRWPRGR